MWLRCVLICTCWALLLGMLPQSMVQAVDLLPYFEETPCFEGVPRGYNARCGYVTVAETRDPARADTTNLMRLAVIIIPSRAAVPQPDPVIYLDGGPGGYTLRFASFYLSVFAPLLATRDLILFDQRGVGYSEPSMKCPEYVERAYAQLESETTWEEERRLLLDALRTCAERHVASGVNLAAYNSAENAADVVDIAHALGFEQVNLLGISYGTRLGLHVLRDAPQLVRAAVFDGVYPPHLNSYHEIVRNTYESFERLFAACAGSSACAAAHPNLSQDFYDLLLRLDESPVLRLIYDPSRGRSSMMMVTGEVLVSALFNMLYDTERIPELPGLIQGAIGGDYDPFLRELLDFTAYIDMALAENMYFAVECADGAFAGVGQDWPAQPMIPAQAMLAISPELLEQADFMRYACPTLGRPAAHPGMPERVTSVVPVLLLSGEFDPVTPTRWAEDAAQGLSNHYLFELPGVGHSAYLSGNCGQSLAIAFLNDPLRAPNAGCIDQMPRPLPP